MSNLKAKITINFMGKGYQSDTQCVSDILVAPVSLKF